ncbi:Uncharacterized protein GBIM_06914 [Gryllus bimaculatus]|nr:Uncharacterized protein GBIM_06914 [Gryllus bimaculatus]
MKVLLIVAPTVLVAHKGFAAEEVHKETLLHQRSAQSDRFLTPLDPAQTMKLLRALRVRHYFDEVALLPQATGISPAPKIPALHQSRPVVPLLQQQATVRWFRAVAGYALASVRDLRGVFLWGRAKRERLCCRLVLVPFDHREIRERVKMMVNKGPYNAVYSDERGGKRKRLGGGDMRPHGRASHLLVVTFDLAAMLLVGAYSAAIISTLASKPMPLPYKSVSHLLRNPGHRVTFAEDSAEKCVIMNSKDPTLTRISNMWGYPRPPDTVRSTGHGVRRLCEDNWAFFGRYRLIYNMTLLQSSQCLPVELPGAHVNLNVAFLWAPNRRYLRLFNYRINCLRRAGILQKYFSKPWESRDPDEQFVAVRLLNVVPLFAMLAVGAGGALLLLAVEIVCAYCTRGRHLPPWDRYNNKNLK